ncbi:hypothetical protein L1887_14858 [Cichorium endivia]|nr:hypothetical protein L1887_14858 [Cichorium endivia]
MFPSQVNNGSGGAEGGQDNQNIRDQIAIEIPQVVRQPQAQPTHIAHSSTSVARMEEMAEQIRARDAQIAQMQQALRAAGLLPNDEHLEDEGVLNLCAIIADIWVILALNVLIPKFRQVLVGRKMKCQKQTLVCLI